MSISFETRKDGHSNDKLHDEVSEITVVCPFVRQVILFN